ncbi:MAG: 5-formyltetrahydrofolate cyclo-ligase [bacterium]|nr:5-formyltetrahydrofolate cyclo-ligase [bacterium]
MDQRPRCSGHQLIAALTASPARWNPGFNGLLFPNSMTDQTISYSELSHLKTWAFPDSASLRKRALRATLRAQRQAQDPRVARFKSRKIAERLQYLPWVAQARTLSLYAALGDEVGTDDLAHALLRLGKQLVFPVIRDKTMHFHAVSDMDRGLSERGAFGIREPDPARCPVVAPDEIDIFLTPGMAYDLFGGRVGFGAGYYDRYLSQRRPDARVVGLAYEFQVLHAFPVEPTDILLDAVVTEERVYQPTWQRFRCPKEGNTASLAELIYENDLLQGGCLLLHADLGTGKTVFVKGLARRNACTEDTLSPTFIYCRTYHGRMPLVHVDGYRVDALQRGDTEFWNELLQQPGIVAIEWAEQLGDLVPKDALHLFGRVLDDGAREWILFTPVQTHGVL